MSGFRSFYQYEKNSTLIARQVEIVGKHFTNATQAVLNAAFYSKFLMTPEELSQLRGIISNRFVQISPHANRFSTHAVAASLLQFAAADLISEASLNMPYIDIGGNILHATTNAHTCLLATNTRDLSRYLSNLGSVKRQHEDLARNIWDKNKIFEACNELLPEQKFSICFRGGECCNKQAKTLIMNHALYDINLEKVYDMFEKHNSTKLVTWTFYPPELFYEINNLHAFEETLKFYTYREDGDIASMFFGDCSFGYHHNKKNWRQLFEVNLIEGPKFDITVEVVDQVGCMFKQRFTAVPKARNSILCHYYKLSVLSEYTAVLDLPLLMHSGYTRRQNIVVPMHFYDRVMNMALKTIELKKESIHVYAIAISTQIDISETVIVRRVNLGADVMDHFVYTIVMMAIVYRFHDRNDFNDFIHVFTNHHDQHFGKIDIMLCKRLRHEIMNWWTKRKFRRHHDMENDDFGLDNVAPAYFEPLLFDTRVRVHESLWPKFMTNLVENGQKSFFKALPGEKDFILNDFNPYCVKIAKFSDYAFKTPKIEYGVNYGYVEHIAKVMYRVFDDNGKFKELTELRPKNAVDVENGECYRVWTETGGFKGFSTKPIGEPFKEREVKYEVALPSPEIVKPSQTTISTVVKINHVELKSRYVYRIMDDFSIPTLRLDFMDELLPIDESVQLAQNDPLYKLAEKLALSAQVPKHQSRALLKIRESFQYLPRQYYDTILDCGCAPGYSSIFTKMMCNHLIGVTLGDIPVANQLTLNYRDIIIHDLRAKFNYHASGLLVISDIGPVDATEDTLTNVLDIIVNNRADFIIKSYFNRPDLNAKIFAIGSYLTLLKPIYSKETNFEFYIIGQYDKHEKGNSSILMFNNACFQLEARRRVAVHNWLHLLNIPFYRESIDKQIIIDLDIKREMFYNNSLLEYYVDFTDHAPEELIAPLKNVIKVPEDLYDFKVKVYSGVFGCGKTTFLKNYIEHYGIRNYIIISTNRRLTEQARKEGFSACTHHVAFTKKRKEQQVIFLDEAFTLDIEFIALLYYHFEPKILMLLGDPKQITAIDWTKAGVFSPLKNLYSIVNNQHTYRSPLDVAQIARGIGYDKCTTSSPVTNSIFCVNATMQNLPALKILYGEGELMVYNRDSAYIHRCSTIHQRLGDSADVVYLYIDANAIDTSFHDALEHITVAVSRHRDKLVVFGDTTGFRTILDYWGSNMSINLEKYGFQAADVALHRSVVAQNTVCLRPKLIPLNYTVSTYQFPNTPFVQIFDIIKRMFKIPENYNYFFSVVNTNMQYSGHNQMRIKMETLLNYMREKVEGYVVSYQEHCPAARSQGSDSLTCVDSALRRHNRKILKQTPDVAIQSAAEMLNAMADKFLRKFDDCFYDESIFDVADDVSIKIYQLLNNNARNFMHFLRSQSSFELIMRNLKEYLHAIDKKVLPRDQYDKLIETMHNMFVSFFPKYQIKPSGNANPMDVDKASQGVSSYDKNVNMLYAAYGRTFAHLLQMNTVREVLFAANMPDVEFSAKVGTLMKDHNDKIKFSLGDFEQFDSTQNLMAIYLMHIFYAACGMPFQLLQKYDADSKDWTLKTPYLQLHGVLQMLSGKFETWIRNTTYNMGVCAFAYEFQKLIIALFTGDDSGIGGENVRFMKDRTWLTDRGLRLKNEESDYLEFAGKVLIGKDGKYAMVPDPFRRLIKYITKIYKDMDHYNETIISLRNGFEMYLDDSITNMAFQQLANYYNDTKKYADRFSAGDVEVILGFLYHEVHKPRRQKDLVHVNKPILYEYCLPAKIV